MIDPTNPDYANTPAAPGRPEYGYGPADPLAAPAVSIVTPFYNPGLVFHETARSVFRQSLQQWEWLVVNDGSTDSESLRVLGEYRQADPRIRVIDQEGNRGPGAARNAGFAAARAEYVVQLDSDDLLEPTAIEKWLWYLTSYPEFGMVKGFTVWFGAQTRLDDRGFHDGEAYLIANMGDVISLVRREVWRATGGYDETLRAGHEDWDFWLRCANAGRWGGMVPEYLGWYRRRPTHSDRWADWDDAGRRAAAIREELRQRYPRLWEGEFPRVQPSAPDPGDPLPDALPRTGRLGKAKPRLLAVLPGVAVGQRDLLLEALRRLVGAGWELTVAATASGDALARLAEWTPDVFALPRFLRRRDQPRFLRYLIRSRQVDAVAVCGDALGYRLLPYLRAHHPEVAYLDLPSGRAGDPADDLLRAATELDECLDLHVVSSDGQARRLIGRGVAPERVAVCPALAGGAGSGDGAPGADDLGRTVRAGIELGRREPRPPVSPAIGRLSARQAIQLAELAAVAPASPSEAAPATEPPAGWEALSATWDGEIRRLRDWFGSVDAARVWWEEQAGNWRRLAEERQAWITELETDKAWLAGQRDNWQRLAEERQASRDGPPDGHQQPGAEGPRGQGTPSAPDLPLVAPGAEAGGAAGASTAGAGARPGEAGSGLGEAAR